MNIGVTSADEDANTSTHDAAGSQSGSTGWTLVLGGGGATGMAYEIGVLRALQDSGLEPQTADLVIGTSCGAFVGAALRNEVALETLLAPPPGAAAGGEALNHLEKA